MAEAATRQLIEPLAKSVGLDADVVESVLTEGGGDALGGEDSALLDAVADSVRKHLETTAAAMHSPLAYVAQQYPGSTVDCALLTGHGASIRGAAEQLQRCLGINTRTVAPADIVQCPASLKEKAADPSLVAAVGLAQFRE
jgi:Tfp pilus assembly PilM family ATPase